MSIHDIYDLDQGWATLDLEGHCPIWKFGLLKSNKVHQLLRLHLL